MNVIHALKVWLTPPSRTQRPRYSERDLIRQESKIGGRIFGIVPPDRKRDFFCLDSHTWVWHEEWDTPQGRAIVTTRYELRGEQIIKIQTGASPTPVHGEELQNLTHAIQAYYHRVMNEVYKRPVLR